MAKILIVDDSTFERKTVGDILRNSGYKEILEAEDGEKGLEVFVLLDIRMPGLSGVEVLQKLVEKHPTVKVVMVSIIRDQASIDECMRLGAKGYVNKPVTSDKLLPHVKSLIG